MKNISKTFCMLVFSGSLFACVAGLITWPIMMGDPWAGLGILAVGFVIGYPIGVIVGIVIVKKYLHYQGSLVFSIIGVVLGGVISNFIFDYIVIGSSPLPSTIEWTLMFVITPLLGTLGYCLVKKSTNTTA